MVYLLWWKWAIMPKVVEAPLFLVGEQWLNGNGDGGEGVWVA